MLRNSNSAEQILLIKVWIFCNGWLLALFFRWLKRADTIIKFNILFLNMIFGVLILSALVVLLIIVGFFQRRRQLKKRLEAIRAQWASPKIAQRNFKNIDSYLRLSGTEENTSSADLDKEELFSFIDRTNSKSGQQLLYKLLYGEKSAHSDFTDLEQTIKKFEEDEELRELTELELAALNNVDAYYLPKLFSEDQTPIFGAAVNFYIKIGLPLLFALIVAFSIVHSQVYFLLIMACLISNVVLHLINKSRVVRYTYTLPQILLLHKAGAWLYERGLIARTEDFEQSLKTVSRLKRSLRFVDIQNKMNSDPTDISYLFTEWLKMFLLIEPLNFIYSINIINKHRVDIHAVFLAVAKVDVAVSVLSLRKGLPYFSLPVFSSDAGIVIKDLYHPLVENCVANSIQINNTQGVLITGSNMSGKTTFVKALAINALLAQTINTSFSACYQAPPLNVFTSINIQDDLGEHTSFYQAEAISIGNIIQNCLSSKSQNHLVIIDEIFRGTNTIERIAAAKAVISYFVSNGIFVIVSTHDLELTELLDDDCRVFSFEELMEDGLPKFDYKIKEGLLKNKNGIAVLQRLGYPNIIIEEASKVSAQLRKIYKIQ